MIGCHASHPTACNLWLFSHPIHRTYIIQTDTDDKAEIPLQNENNAVKPIDNTERVNVPETAVKEKIEGTYRERIEDKNDTVQEAETEKSSLPEKDIQKMIQSAGKILRD